MQGDRSCLDRSAETPQFRGLVDDRRLSLSSSSNLSCPTSPPEAEAHAAEKQPSGVGSRRSTPPFLKSVSTQSSACSDGKISSGVCYCVSNDSAGCTTHLKFWLIR